MTKNPNRQNISKYNYLSGDVNPNLFIFKTSKWCQKLRYQSQDIQLLLVILSLSKSKMH